ncbi:hypothetical protein PQR71_42380 [Paraburkholderia fungorum]|uniref:hypothetical protein n=1 Tax=Paraburkholderia fungorum TaxID=134537 RepID=UPI0038B732DB
MIVMAEDESDAYQCARENASEAWGDTYDPQIDVCEQMKTEADLKRHKWDGQCIPYGGDGSARLSDIFAAIEAEPERDTRTIDMFSERR